MQIDFHHTTTYVVARLAGFNKPQADIIAHAAQYVDDATNSGTVFFDNKALYNRISSAHKILDIRNTRALANHQVWIPFHFLPGNGGKGMGKNPKGKFINKIVCIPDSPVAQNMVENAIINQNRPYSLHLLGIVMHAYADTWAHQGFAGVIHPVNEVEKARDTGNSGVFNNSLTRILHDFLDDAIPPLGHGRALIFPDLPFLSWEYKNGNNELITRNNTDIFCDAANGIFKTMGRYLAGNPAKKAGVINKKDMAQIRLLFSNTKEKDGEKRHTVWLKAIRDGKFSFGPERVAYAARGKGSWKERALGTSHDLSVHTYNKQFLNSNWKLFHDAIQAYRFIMIHDILPKFGICAA